MAIFTTLVVLVLLIIVFYKNYLKHNVVNLHNYIMKNYIYSHFDHFGSSTVVGYNIL